MDTYKINIEGLDRELRKFPVNDKLDIAAFIMFGDIEMTEVAARELLKRVPEHDVVVTAGHFFPFLLVVSDYFVTFVRY